MAATNTTFQLDPNGMTIAQMEVIEDYTGLDMGEFQAALKDLAAAEKAGRPLRLPTRLACAVVFLAGNQTDPEFTIEDARAMRLTEIASVLPAMPTARRPKNPKSAAPLSPLAPTSPRRRAAKSAS